ncbi:MAG: M1 family metallopeptidase [Bacteroidetes bacterium]|nr:M1 family metallopeptidase [Bacteroidota bacterium]
MLKPLYLFTLAFLFYTSALSAQDCQSLHIKASFDTISESINAEVELNIRLDEELDTLVLNAIRLEVAYLYLNGDPVFYRQNDTALFIPLRPGFERINLAIKYVARPRKGLYFIGWQDQSERARRQIWTQGQGIDHRHWIPHIDNQKDKIIFSAEWIFKSDYELMSNGRLDSVKEVNGHKHWHYSMDKPMSSYLIALVIGQYHQSKCKVLGHEHYLYHYPDRISDSAWYYHQHQEIARFLEQEINYNYPWLNYKQAPVMDFRHGAMENTCATIFGDFFLVDSISFNDRNYTYVDAHEYAHQWFGNLVTAAGSKHHWLHEGFATYYQWLSEENLYGRDYFDWELQKAKEMVFEATAQAPLPLAHPKAGSARFYQKGAWLLYMLRNFVGDSIYRKVIAEYLNEGAYKVVENQDLIALFKKHSNKDIDGFFETWLYADKEPELKIEREEGSAKVRLTLKGKLLQPLYIHHSEGDVNLVVDTIFLKEGVNEFQLPSEESRFFIANHQYLLLKVEAFKNLNDWRFHAVYDSSVLGQNFALKGLSEFTFRDDLMFAAAAVENTELHFSTREIALQWYIKQIEKDRIKAKYLDQLLLNSGKSYDEVQFQKSIVSLALKEEIRLDDALLEELRSRGRSYDLRSMAIEASIKPNDLEANRWLYDSIWKEQPGTVGRNVYVKTLFFRLVFFRDGQAYSELLDLASPSFDFNTRMNALRYLAVLDIDNDEYLAVLFEAFFNTNWKLVRVAREKLLEIQKLKPAVFNDFYDASNKSWSDFQKRKAARTFEGE